MDDLAPAFKPGEPVKPQGADPGDRTVNLEPGQLIAERYKIISLIGKGGMGAVYHVEQVFLHTQMALKTLNPGCISPTAWRRFQKEARAASVLDHPGLVKVHDFGLLGETQPFLVMDYAEGETLAQRIKSGGAQPLDAVLDIFTQVALALGTAHHQGVIHRDIKPSNIIVCGEYPHQKVRIVDFGIAKVISDVDPVSLTQTGEIFGTPQYMSPEQCLGLATDHRSDIYSLGCSMFEALTGSPPLVADSLLAVMMKHQSENAPSLQEASLGKQFPAALEQVMKKLLDKRPELRYQDLFSLATDLQKVVRRENLDLHGGTGSAPGKDRQKRDFLIPATAAAVAIMLIGAFAVVRMTAPAGHSPAATQEEPSIVTLASEPLVKSFADTKRGEHFSSMVPGDESLRYFHFPADDSVGWLTVKPQVKVMSIKDGRLARHQAKDALLAQGDLLFTPFQPFELRPSAYACGNLKGVFQAFRSDEIDGLNLKENFRGGVQVGDIDDSTVEEIARFNKLRSLDLEKSRVTSKIIDVINEHFPCLESLDVSTTKVTFRDVARLKRLKQLEQLYLKEDGVSGKAELLAQLKQSRVLRFLGLRGNPGITDPDVRIVAQIPRLCVLDLGNCSSITDTGIGYLARCRYLQELRLDQCHVTPRILDSLKQLPILAKLTLPQDWTVQQKDSAHDLLDQHCQVYFGD